jgi:Rhodopirellula transposase DDE domain
VNALADADAQTLRISIDTKATVHVGDYCRGGRSRGLVALKALDHDMCVKEKLVPGGILEPVSGQSFVFFGASCKTSDFIGDGLMLWWQHRRPELGGVKQLVINLDNGPECNGRRSQFLLRMSEFADLTGLSVRLVYLLAISQQIQRHRALLGRAGEVVEWLLAEHGERGAPSGRQFSMERRAHHRQLARRGVRERRESLRQRKNRP